MSDRSQKISEANQVGMGLSLGMIFLIPLIGTAAMISEFSQLINVDMAGDIVMQQSKAYQIVFNDNASTLNTQLIHEPYINRMPLNYSDPSLNNLISQDQNTVRFYFREKSTREYYTDNISIEMKTDLDGVAQISRGLNIDNEVTGGNLLEKLDELFSTIDNDSSRRLILEFNNSVITYNANGVPSGLDIAELGLKCNVHTENNFAFSTGAFNLHSYTPQKMDCVSYKELDIKAITPAPHA